MKYSIVTDLCVVDLVPKGGHQPRDAAGQKGAVGLQHEVGRGAHNNATWILLSVKLLG